MIKRIAATITKWLLEAGAISSDDEELYEYAAYSLIFGLLPIFFAAIIGSFLGMLVESAFMIIPFMLIRKFCGGFHLNSSKSCFFSSIILITAFILFLKYVLAKGNYSTASLIVTASAMQIFLCSPISSENRPLERNEYTAFKKMSRILVTVFIIIYFCLLLTDFDKVALPIGFGIILTAVLQLPCIAIGLVKEIFNIRA